MHLTRRELASTHRNSVLGLLWPVIRIGSQLAVFVLVFHTVLQLHIHDYPAFVLCGLATWTWLSTALVSASGSVVAHRDLVFQPRFPLAVIPFVALVVSLVDLLVVLPLVFGFVIGYGQLGWSALFLPVLIVIQLVLMSGIAWLTSAAHVYLRDVQAALVVVMLLLFYLTPVFYESSSAPHKWRWLLDANPATTLVDAWRAVLLEDRLPAAGGLLAVFGAGLVVGALGIVFFRRLDGSFVDEL